MNGPQIETLKFPLVWHGRLVTVAETENVPEAVQQIFLSLGVRDGQVTPGNASAKGSYLTWALQGTMADLPMLRAVFLALENLPGVKMLF